MEMPAEHPSTVFCALYQPAVIALLPLPFVNYLCTLC